MHSLCPLTYLPKAIQLCDVKLKVLEDRAIVWHEGLELVLHLPETILFSLSNQRQGCALVGASSRPAHTVDVAVYTQGKIKVDDVRHKLEVNAS